MKSKTKLVGLTKIKVIFMYRYVMNEPNQKCIKSDSVTSFRNNVLRTNSYRKPCKSKKKESSVKFVGLNDIMAEISLLLSVLDKY